jgi:hypothetical protein
LHVHASNRLPHSILDGCYNTLRCCPSLATTGTSTSIWRVSGFDLYDALQAASRLYTDSVMAQCAAMKQLHVILLVVTIFLMLGFTVLLFRPYRKRITDEATKVAGLLSLLPPECDVEGHVKTAMRVCIGH